MPQVAERHDASKKMSDRVLCSIILITLAVLLTMSGTLNRFDNIIYDAAQRWYPRKPPSDVMLIAIDEQSLKDIGRWPWSRHQHAKLVRNLSAEGAKVIGLDLILSEPEARDTTADLDLTEAIQHAGNVVLPVVMERTHASGQLIETQPLSKLASSADAIGRPHAELDADSIARGIVLWEGLGTPAWPHFAQAMLKVANDLPPPYKMRVRETQQVAPYVLVKQAPRLINFVSAQERFSSISYIDVIRGEFAPNTFRGKTVLVGATASGLSDVLPTPISGFQQAMPGVEFLANTLVSMRSETLITRASMWINVVLCALFAWLPMLWLPRLSIRSALLATITFFWVLIAISMALPVLFYVWLPSAGALAAALMAYPLWAWRKLESATAYLDGELSRLRGEMQRAHMGELASLGWADIDPFQSRIAQVKTATETLQKIDQEQREALAFITHDIRVPMSSALFQLQTLLGEAHPACVQLERALGWAEHYLQTSRAQLLDQSTFHEVDSGSLLHQALDDAYPLAQQKQITLHRNIPDQPIWIYAEFDSLLRAVLNLLSNSIKFSDPGTRIELKAWAHANHLLIQISDEGPGIEPQHMTNLFQRFSRISQKGVQQAGFGLGLYFVQIVTQKHGGKVSVAPLPRGSAFTIELPISARPHTVDTEH